MSKKCCMCRIIIEREDAPVLSMGVGHPRLLCDECASLLDTATLSREFSEIEDAMDKVGLRMKDNDPDRVTISIVSSIMSKASERAKAIAAGEYDFSLDEEAEDSEDGFDEIPEELCESEEDRELDRKDEEKQKRFDKVYNVILALACIALVGLIIWKLVDTFFLN